MVGRPLVGSRFMRLLANLLGVGVMAVAASAGILRDWRPALYRGHRSAAEDSEIRDQDIAFYAARAARDPSGAIDLAQLSALYLHRARATGDNGDLLRAEATARHSLRNRANRNRKAQAVLTSSLMAQHRFAEASLVAEAMVAADSTGVAQRATRAEIDLELGRYDSAGAALGSLALYRTDLAVAPRLARWAELRGRPEEARRLLRGARDEARRRVDLPVEQLAWYQLRLGDLAFRYGHLAEARRELEIGLEIAPDDYRLLSSLARLEAALHRWRQAIDYGEQAIRNALDPATLGVVGDAYAAIGDSTKAAEYYHAVQVVVLHQPGPFHRAWSLFLLDHDRNTATVLAKAREELQTRRDIYGYDLLAWSLHKSGRDTEARDAMRHALALGTRDATLFFHAGMIQQALGDQVGARAHLEAALETNPFWHPFQPSVARAVLDSIGTR
jgi:tetratricopeptide (TPR) repeat protein